MQRAKPSRGTATGVVAGVIATRIMDQFQNLNSAAQKKLEEQKLADGESPDLIEQEQAAAEQQAAQQEASTEIVARKIAETTNTPLNAEDKKTAGQAVHYAFGTLMGVVYGLTSELLPEVTIGAGAYGTLLFLTADEIAVPAFQRLSISRRYAHLQSTSALGGSRRLRWLT